MQIPFNKPHITGKELEYIKDAISRGHISGNGYYTKHCQSLMQQRYGFHKCLLTSSGTDALEMAAILLDIKAGDEVIMPSYTFVSTANAFLLRGATIVFCDSRPDHPGMDESKLEALITPRTKAVVPVHYAGVACDMDVIMSLADKYGLLVVEDAAQAVDSFYKGRSLGGIGHLGCFSFHETKNISCGEGGMLAINDPRFAKRAEIIWEKGTNRAAFYRGEIDKYGWVDIGSSFLPSELAAAFLCAQLEHLDEIQERRLSIWQSYRLYLSLINPKHSIQLPYIPDYATNNAHMFYLSTPTEGERTELITRLKAAGFQAIFHYQALHKAVFYTPNPTPDTAPWASHWTDCLLRLPLYHELPNAVPQQVARLLEEV